MLFVAAFALASCVDDIVDTPTAESKAGEDVQFGLSLESTRTIYGDAIIDDNKIVTAFPIYWSNNDKVQIYSPECAAGHNDAEYNVTPVASQSYAEKLTKTGAYGVQWGDNETANFYSVYPSLNAEFSGSGDAVTAKLHISNEQKSNASYGRYTDMDNVVMYAQTNDVAAGDIVNLKYTPYSTVLSFTLNLGMVNGKYGSADINTLTLTAPEGTAIAGDFNLKFNDANAPTITAVPGNNTNSITVTFAVAPTLNEKNTTLTINVPVIPLSGANINGWKVEVNVNEGASLESKTYTKTLGNGTLAPGKIHKITLPTIAPETAWTYNLANWITSLDDKEVGDYKKIYLTELSIPGAWYAGAPTSDGYQATDNITTLWNAGIRAFAVECRTLCSFKLLGAGTPEAVVISGTGRNSAYGDYRDDGSTTKIRSTIASIAGSIGTGEFAVLVLSYADGGEGGQRGADHQYFINGVKSEIANSGVTNIIYDKEITPETTVGDVVGKLIIKINVDAELSKSSYDNSANMLLSYVPHMNQLTNVDFSVPMFSKMYWKNWDDTYKTTTTTTTDFLWCFSTSNRTQVDTGTNATIPTYKQRKTALSAMMSHAAEIDKKSTHNVWFYFNAGGTETTSDEDDNTSATTFAKNMNPWLLNTINLKVNGGKDEVTNQIIESDPSPLGIVMFNQCTGDNNTYKGEDIIKAIIEMNKKFDLERYKPNTEDDDEPVTDPFA